MDAFNAPQPVGCAVQNGSSGFGRTWLGEGLRPPGTPAIRGVEEVVSGRGKARAGRRENIESGKRWPEEDAESSDPPWRGQRAAGLQ